MKHTLNVGDKVSVANITLFEEGIFIGFLVNQIPVNWQNKKTYLNHPDKSIYYVVKLEESYILTRPYLYTYEIDGRAEFNILLSFLESAESLEILTKKMGQNFVFTPKLTYAARYKENFNPDTDLDWRE